MACIAFMMDFMVDRENYYNYNKLHSNGGLNAAGYSITLEIINNSK